MVQIQYPSMLQLVGVRTVMYKYSICLIHSTAVMLCLAHGLCLGNAQPGCFSTDEYGLYIYLMATLSSAALLALAISSTIFIIVTIILIGGKARAQRDLKLARETTKEMTEVVYEEVDLNQQAELAPSIISTRDNIAYDHVPKI